MKVATLATWDHYAAHMMPTVEVLQRRGADVTMLSTRRDVWWGEYRHRRDLAAVDADLWMVAGEMDRALVPAGRRIVYVEHGIGQTYEADVRGTKHPSYSTGDLPGVALYLCPNLFVTHRRKRTGVPSYLVGSPRLDHLHAHARGWHRGVDRGVVAIAFHWDCQLMPETQSAWEHYRPHLGRVVLELRRLGLRLVGTAHPRIAKRVRWHLDRIGIEWWDSDDVLAHAAVLAVDNSSLGYEFASLDRPTVWMNAPWYRRHVHHGLRFWEAIPGEQVDEWDQLAPALHRALVEDPHAAQRDVVNALVMPARDGRAAIRAAEAVRRVA